MSRVLFIENASKQQKSVAEVSHQNTGKKDNWAIDNLKSNRFITLPTQLHTGLNSVRQVGLKRGFRGEKCRTDLIWTGSLFRCLEVPAEKVQNLFVCNLDLKPPGASGQMI